MLKENSVYFIDSIMGSGKSSAVIKYINENKYKKFLVVCVYNSEVDRFCEACQISQPVKVFGSKINDLEALLKLGKSIVITHELFTRDLPYEFRKYFGEYELIIDEVLTDIFETIDLKDMELDTAVKHNAISIDDKTGRICVLNRDLLSMNKRLYDATKNFKILYRVGKNQVIQTFLPDLFSSFKKCYICTYMSKYSLMNYYFKIFDIGIKYLAIDENYSFIESSDFIYNGNKFAELVYIDKTPRRNLIGNKVNLSFTRYGESRKHNQNTIEQNLSLIGYYFNGFLREIKAEQPKVLWTLYGKDEKTMKKVAAKEDNKIIRYFSTEECIDCTSRATNIYADKKYLGYLVDRNLHPAIINFMLKQDISFDRKYINLFGEEGMWAVSEMIQWIWRSTIRNNNNIYVYIPSAEMRQLFEYWLYEGIPC